MADGTFFKRKTPQERLREQKKFKSREKYESSQIRGFQADWKNGRDWLECALKSDLYTDEVETVKAALIDLKSLRSKLDESFDDEEVKNVMICLPCREKYYADNKLSYSYLPGTSDFDKNPYVFGCISFRKPSIEKHSNNTNTFHGLAVTRKKNLKE